MNTSGIKLNQKSYLAAQQAIRNAKSTRRLRAMKSAATTMRRGVHKKHRKSAAKGRNGHNRRNGNRGGGRSKKYKKGKKFRHRPSKSTKKSNTNRKRRYFHFLSL